jgi:hypothetical protein
MLPAPEAYWLDLDGERYTSRASDRGRRSNPPRARKDRVPMISP